MAATTIHSCIYHAVPTPGGGVLFRLKQRYEIGCAGIMIDEASMVSADLYRDLLSFGLPCIFVGDHGQLPPVGSDVNVMADPQYKLEKIHRNAGEIAYFAEHLRKGRPARTFLTDGRVRVVETGDVTDDLLLGAGQMICAFNNTRVGVNQRIRRLLGRRSLVERGDRIICLRNSRAAGLFNGQQGRVLAVYPGRPPRLDFKSDGVVYEGVPYAPAVFGVEKPEINFNPDAPHPFDYSHCVTAHKSQGSEWNKVLVFEQPCRHWDNRRWNYTASSRARRRLTWVAAGRGPSVRGGWPGRKGVSR